ncbi:hypothetical protein WMY93_022862 [Mugilogobius chulae]|uniref:Uncharacterized protein n=1 Tax=Mugilogobius chulae TaxID=88201 RepID=A0AAW0N9H5_9GOBI
MLSPLRTNLNRDQLFFFSYEHFTVSCDLLYVNTKICETSVSDNISTALAYGNKIQCNRPIVFPVELKNLPYESMLRFRLMGSKKGRKLCKRDRPTQHVHSARAPGPSLPALADAHRQPMGVLIQLEFSDKFEWTFRRPWALPEANLFTQPCEDVRKKMQEADGRMETCNLTGIYTVVDNWAIHLPEEALFSSVTTFMIKPYEKHCTLFEQIPDALRNEWQLDGPLAMLLLERSVKNIRIAQQLTEDAHCDPHYQSWFKKLQAALRHCCGRTLRKELVMEARLVSLLTQVADKVRLADKKCASEFNKITSCSALFFSHIPLDWSWEGLRAWRLPVSTPTFAAPIGLAETKAKGQRGRMGLRGGRGPLSAHLGYSDWVSVSDRHQTESIHPGHKPALKAQRRTTAPGDREG